MTVDQEQISYLFQSKIVKRPLMATSGKGCRITIEDPITKQSKTLLDGSTGAAVGSLGHADPDIAKEFELAGRECVYTFPYSVCNYWAEDLAKFVIDHSPKGAFASALFTCSGSESNENAIKIIRQYHLERGEPKRIKYISRNQSYHGFTIGALSIGQALRFKQFKPLCMPKEQTPKVSECNPYRNMREGEHLEQYKDRLLEEVEEAFQAAGTDEVAAFLCETVSGSTLACQPPVPGYLEGCRAIAHKYGALFMLDEVMCGMGRCGTYHAWQQFLPEGQSPDIQTIGKTLGSGYVTLAGVLVSPLIKDTIANGSGAIIGAQTYHSHSVNCRIGLAVQKKVAELGLVENSYKMGEYMARQLQQKLGNHKYVGCLKGAGLFRGVEFVKDKNTKESFDPSLHFGPTVGQNCYKNGLTVMGGDRSNDGIYGDHVVISPSYVIDKETVDELVDILLKSINETVKELGL